jgi:ribonuclease D
LRDRLAQSLEHGDRFTWLREECDVLCTRELAKSDRKTKGFLRIKGAGALPPEQLAILQGVYLLREQWAKKLDRPPFKVMGNGPLMDMAKQAPSALTSLRNIRGVTQLVADRYGEELLEAIETAKALPESKWPRLPRPERQPRAPGTLNRIDRLRAWRKKEAVRRKMDEGVLLSQNIIKALAASAPKDETGLRKVDGLRTWRVQEFGNQLLEALWPTNGKGKAAASVK